MTHEMKLNKGPFLMIEGGEKRYELRLFDEKRRRVSVGDTIVFTMAENAERRLTAEVTALHRFSDFDSLYKALPLTECGYRADEVGNASPRDMEAYYSKEEESRYGVVAIEIKLI